MTKKNNRNYKQTNKRHVNRNLIKIGSKDCNLCKKDFDIYSKFDRFCLSCKLTEIYRGYCI